MKYAIGEYLPDVTLYYLEETGPKEIQLSSLTARKKIILTGMPGAFTDTCTKSHLPSLIRNMPYFSKRGVSDVLCIIVNDVFVAKEWGDHTGAHKAGIKILCDCESLFTKKLELSFTAPKIGLIDRLSRVAMIVQDGKIENLLFEENKGVCEFTSGDSLVSLLDS
jgi:peroxiredoxin